VIESETSCGAWVYWRSTRSHAQRFQESHRSAFPACWTSGWSRLRIRSGPPISLTSRCRRDSSTWWRSLICSLETSPAGSSPKAWMQSSVYRLCRWRWKAGGSPGSSTPTGLSVHLRWFRGHAAGRGNQDQLAMPEALLRQHPGGEVLENGQI